MKNKITLVGLGLIFSLNSFAEMNAAAERFRRNFLGSFEQPPVTLLADPTLIEKLDALTQTTPSEASSFYREVLAQLGRPAGYFQGQTPFVAEKGVQNAEVRGAVARWSPSDVPLIIVMPGIFSEFIKTHAFEETLRNPSLLSQEFADKFQALKWEDSRKVDPQFRLGPIQELNTHLDDLVKIGAVRDVKTGLIVANTLIFQTPVLSFESVGDLRAMTMVLHRRLTKFFSVLGRVPKHIILSGYSRGAMTALDLLAMVNQPTLKPCRFDSFGFQGCEQAIGWTKNIDTYVGFAGVIYGSELADQAFKPGREQLPLMTQRINLLKAAARQLNEPVRSLEEGGTTKLHDIGVFKNFLLEMLAIETSSRWSDLTSEVQAKGLMSTLHEKWQQYRAVPVEKPGDMDLQPVMAMAAEMAFENLKLNTPLKEFNRNVRRFQLLVRHSLAAAESLSTSSRQKWWQENILPAQGIKYYNIGATMITNHEAEGTYTPYAYNRRSPDYFNLRDGFMEFSEKLGFAFNDSQVSLERALIWPRLNTLFNDKQPPLEAYTLAVFQTHHWGIALEQVVNLKDRSLDPFPREIMLSSMVQSIY